MIASSFAVRTSNASMMTRDTIMILALTIVGCDLGKSSLGDVEMDTGTTEEAETTPADSDDGPARLGAPCSHGDIDRLPEATLLTFPALGCDSLLCLYQHAGEPGSECSPDGACADPTWLACDESTNTCRPTEEAFVERSMCSQTCESDDDCEAVAGTACKHGFACHVVSTLGEQCCQKMCVCNDDYALGPADELCATGQQVGCCDREPRPEGCGG
jgi:hypothetical protein